MMRRIALAALAFALLAGSPGRADEPLADPQAEARALALMRELGCPVCDGQPIATSNAQVAVEMRRLVRLDVAEGLSDEAVLSNMAARYDESVRLRPRLDAGGGLLWFSPLLILVFAALGALAVIRRAARNAGPDDPAP